TRNYSLVHGGGDDRRAVVVQRDPLAGIGLRLPLDEGVGRVLPQQDLAVLVVEDEVAAVGADHQHCVAVAIGFTHHGHQQRARIPAGGDQLALLFERDVFAVATSVGRVRPVLDLMIVVLVGFRDNLAVDRIV